jgi:hypothetical protein
MMFQFVEFHRSIRVAEFLLMMPTATISPARTAEQQK